MKYKTSKANKLTAPRQSGPKGLPLLPRAALQTREAAAYVGLSILTLKRLSYRGLLHPNRATGRLLFSIKELDEFLIDPRNSEMRVHRMTSLEKKGRSGCPGPNRPAAM
jgi:hypothetical protein